MLLGGCDDRRKKTVRSKNLSFTYIQFVEVSLHGLTCFSFSEYVFPPKTTNIRTLKLNIHILCVALLFQRNNHRSTFNNH